MSEYITWGEFKAWVEKSGITDNVPIESLSAKTTMRETLRCEVDIHLKDSEMTGADIWLRSELLR